ncbi:hypothetical protein [Fulvitalea axinellae]
MSLRSKTEDFISTVLGIVLGTGIVIWGMLYVAGLECVRFVRGTRKYKGK